ncbi:MAG: hypothetical protein OER88_10630, partial [Planctomycetota bacterium]|nr:hypothetical protein [Planctomycetota bacterium]
MSTWIVLAALVPAVPVILYVAILKNLPVRLEVTVIDEDSVPFGLLDLEDTFLELGFERCGPPMVVGLTPPPLVIPLHHPRDRCYATIYHVRNGNKTGYDIVSLLDADDGVLTSATDPGAGVLPLPEDAFLQILPPMGPADLFRRHHDAMRELDQRGIGTRPISPNAYRDHLRGFIARVRRVFLSRRAVHTFVAIYRSVSRRNPYLGPLQAQEAFDAQVAALRD